MLEPYLRGHVLVLCQENAVNSKECSFLVATSRSTFEEEEMLFVAEEGPILHHGQVVYVQKDQAFNFVPQQITDCSVLIGDVELGFMISPNKSKRASQVWGYCGSPARWIQQRLQVPVFFSGSLLLCNEMIDEGDIVRLEGSQAWNISYDQATSWVCIGDATFTQDDVAVEFATNCGVVLQKDQLKALWLKPIFE